MPISLLLSRIQFQRVFVPSLEAYSVLSMGLIVSLYIVHLFYCIWFIFNVFNVFLGG